MSCRRAKDKDPKTRNRMVTMAQDLAKYCESEQQYHIAKAQEYGYSRDIFLDIASKAPKVSDDLSSTAEASIAKFVDFIEAREKQLPEANLEIASWAYALGTAVTASTPSATGTEINTWLINSDEYPKPPSWSSERADSYASKFELLDPELGRLYRSVWQLFYGGNNPERAAMLSVRQLYDHFFELLAPDEEVKNSSVFSLKAGDKPEQVHRKERIQYAAKVKIADPLLGAALEAQAGYMLKLYKRLNELHGRSALDRRRVREVLTAMQAMLDQWVDALDLS